MSNLVYEKTPIYTLRQGVPFYLGNPMNNHDILPSYNINCELPEETEVYVVYPSWQKNPFIKPEYFAKIEGNQASGIINNLQSDWF